jgi:hypothetical protein
MLYFPLDHTVLLNNSPPISSSYTTLPDTTTTSRDFWTGSRE